MASEAEFKQLKEEVEALKERNRLVDEAKKTEKKKTKHVVPDVEAIKERNVRVEMDKRWETSYTRRILLILFTYLAIALYFVAIDISRPWVNAVVPAAGFLLSTFTLPYFRKAWEKVTKK